MKWTSSRGKKCGIFAFNVPEICPTKSLKFVGLKEFGGLF